MVRAAKSRSQRKPKQDVAGNAREIRTPEWIRRRRYLAFVRAIVASTTKEQTR